MVNVKCLFLVNCFTFVVLLHCRFVKTLLCELSVVNSDEKTKKIIQNSETMNKNNTNVFKIVFRVGQSFEDV